MSKEKTVIERTESQLAEDTIEVIQLEERLEMVQADSLIALASCCMDSEETVKS